MNLLLLIVQGVELIAREIVPIEELILKLRSIFALNPNVTVNVVNLSAEAIKADEETIRMVAKWQADHGLPVTVKPSS